MAHAVQLAQPWQGRVGSRPHVGAVVVNQQGEVVGEGATEGRIGPHAEVIALTKAGQNANGGTLYVTLEPCSHYGVTPPCVDAVKASGVARVVVAVTDPDEKVSGHGIELLEKNGCKVEVGCYADVVERQLRAYLHHRRTGRPFVVLKMATSLDGRIAAPDGSSQWITGEQARQDVHRWRAESNAVIVGAGTIRADDPALNVRYGFSDGENDPERIVLGTVSTDAKVQPCRSLTGPLDEVLAQLGKEGHLQVLVEGGAGVAHDFHAAGLVDLYLWYLAPAFFGGDDAKAVFAGSGVPTIDGLWRGRIVNIAQLGDDLRLEIEA